jgi:hypothetical protein
MFHVCLNGSVVELKPMGSGTEFCFSAMHLLSGTGNSPDCN